MEGLEIILDNIDITKFHEGSQHWVYVIRVINPHNFYVRPTKYMPFVERLESLKPLKKPSCLFISDVVIFNMNRSNDNPKYARGKINRIKIFDHGVVCDILAFDYGHVCKNVNKDYIWECNGSLAKLPSLALHCQLGNCEMWIGDRWSDDCIDAFKYYIANEKAKMTILDKKFNKYIVSLKNSNPYDIATLMAMTGFSTLHKDDNVANCMALAVSQSISLKYKKININDTLHVRVQSGTSFEDFYVAEVNDYKNYLKEVNKITYYTMKETNLSSDKFKTNALVCVKNDVTHKYERAIIKEIIVPKTKAIVKLLDFGKDERAHILNMKPMSEQCMQLPVLAIYCSIEKNVVGDCGFHDLLKPGVEFLIHIKLLGNELESPNIVEILPLRGSS